MFCLVLVYYYYYYYFYVQELSKSIEIESKLSYILLLLLWKEMPPVNSMFVFSLNICFLCDLLQWYELRMEWYIEICEIIVFISTDSSRLKQRFSRLSRTKKRKSKSCILIFSPCLVSAYFMLGFRLALLLSLFVYFIICRRKMTKKKDISISKFKFCFLLLLLSYLIFFMYKLEFIHSNNLLCVCVICDPSRYLHLHFSKLFE